MNAVRGLAVAAHFLAFAPWAPAADVHDLIRTIKSVGPEGAGNAEAARACRELSRLPPADLPRLLAALDDASPAAANWLRSAIDTVAERETAAGRALPAAALEAFLMDTKHSGRGRRLAYELVCSADTTAPRRLLPAMLDDPSAELRYDAVQAALAALRAQPPDAATAKSELHKLLAAARDSRQVDEIAKELTHRGEPVDLVAHFGFITRWEVAGVFDNTDGRGFGTAYPPESGVDLAAKYSGKDGTPVTWRTVKSTDKSGSIDLNRLFPDPAGKWKGAKAAVAYAFAEFELPTERTAQVRVASATAIKVFVNGREALAREAYHQSFDRDMYIAPCRLVKGRNTILVKICQNDQSEAWAQNWMYQLRLTDELGAAIPIKPVTPGVQK
jgi:hypothetical protein